MRRVLFVCCALALGISLNLAQPEDEDLVHTVGAGDTLISIAHAYGVTLDQLLTLNSLRPEALLQIGQGLIVIRAPEYADDGETSVDDADVDEGENAVGGARQRADLPPAPVAQADAPMRDPADISPRLCFTVFQDENHNGMMEPGEDQLSDATIRLLEDEDTELTRYTSDGAAEPICPRGLERKPYLIVGEAPPGYGWTSAARVQVDLRKGGLVMVDFGAKAGLESAPIPPRTPAGADDEQLEDAPRSLLREFSGLFALGLAVIVLSSGMAVSLFVWGRG